MDTAHVSVQGTCADRGEWLALARRVEAAGFERLYVADHPGTAAAPFAALGAAAAVTERIGLGTYVVNAGVWEPLGLANAAATLDVVSGGRAVLGVGAGHTPAEWTATGRIYPPPADRVARMIELVETTRALLVGGAVDHYGPFFTLVAAELTEPRPVQHPLPLLIGGSGPRVLRFGARVAERVGITGLGRTLPDGHRHAAEWSDAALARTLDTIRGAAASAGREPVMEALVQYVEITHEAPAVAAELAGRVTGASVEDLLHTPFLWIGTVAEIRDRLRWHEETHGITHYVVREAALADVARILETA
jgi:probable F420-dependent oxidoreductase